MVAQLLELNSLGERFYLLSSINVSLVVHKGVSMEIFSTNQEIREKKFNKNDFRRFL